MESAACIETFCQNPELTVIMVTHHFIEENRNSFDHTGELAIKEYLNENHERTHAQPGETYICPTEGLRDHFRLKEKITQQ